MNFLVTGGLGVIGSCFTRFLLDGGHSVRIIDACDKPRNVWTKGDLLRSAPKGKLEIATGRLEFSKFSRDFFDDLDGVVHAAAHTGIPHSAENPLDDWASNVDATRVLLESLRHRKPVPTVIMSSVKPYGGLDRLKRPFDIAGKELCPADATWWHGVDEDFPLLPDEPYAASKMAQSALAVAYARAYDLPVVCLRFSNLYGPAPCHGPRHGWLTWFAIASVIGAPIEVQGAGDQVRDMLYADDVNTAIMAALRHAAHGGAGALFNVGGGGRNTVSVREAVEMVKPLVVHNGPARRHDDSIFYTDHRRFTAATGWAPKMGVADGVMAIMAWAKKNEGALREIYAEHLS